jgi:hypothetical protein
MKTFCYRVTLAALFALSLAACQKKPDPNANLYATAPDKAAAILAGATLPNDILIDAGTQQQFHGTTERVPGQSVTWAFDRFGYHLITAQAHLTPEGDNATRVTVDVHLFDDSTLANVPGLKSIVALANGLPNVQELLHQNFVEFVDASLTARSYDPTKAGQAYAAAHQAETQAERQKYETAVAAYTQSQSPTTTAPIPAPAQAGAHPIVMTQDHNAPIDPTAPAWDPKPSSDGKALFSPPDQTPPQASGYASAPNAPDRPRPHEATPDRP